MVTLKARPPPPHLDGPTPTELALEKAREQNRARAAEKYAEAKPFRLRVLERPSNLEKLKLEVEEVRAEAHAFRPVKARPVPAAPEAKVRAAVIGDLSLLGIWRALIHALLDGTDCHGQCYGKKASKSEAAREE